MINIIIADDHRIFIDGIRTALQGVEGINIIAEAHNGKQVLELLRTVPIDEVLLDINMPEMDGLEAARHIKEDFRHVKVIMLTQYDDRGFIKWCKKMGVEGYLLKDCDPGFMSHAIRLVFEGGTVFGTKNGNSNRFPVPDLLNKIQITGQEHEVLKLMASEYCNADIARELNIEINTVKTYKDRLKTKAGVKTTIGLIKWAIENGLI